MWAKLLPRLDGDIAVKLHMHPPYIDIDDPALAGRSWHWLRDRVLVVMGYSAIN